MSNRNKSLIMLVVFLVVIGAYFTYQITTKAKGSSGSSASAVKPLEVTGDTFEDEVFEFFGVVVVDFYSNSCPPCRRLAPVMENLNGEFHNNASVKFVKVNVANQGNYPLAMQYNITSIPTILFFLNGELEATMNGFAEYETEKNIRAKVNELIEQLVSR